LSSSSDLSKASAPAPAPAPTRAPAPAVGPAALALAVAESDVEVRLIEQWVADERSATGQPVQLVRDSITPLAAVLSTTADAVVTPVAVVWLPAGDTGNRSSRWPSLMLLTSPRRPGRRRQRTLAEHSPERYRVVAGEPATLADLRARHARETGSTAGGTQDAEAFARFVRRAAVLTLERARRRLIGDRYKVPRLVAEQISDSAPFQRRLAELATELNLPLDQVRTRATTALNELVAVQSELATDIFAGVMRPMHDRAWTVQADDAELTKLRELNRRHALIFLPSHRSYADPFILASALSRHDFPRNHVMGGSNLNFWPMGPLARRAGLVFIRRSFGDDEVYKSVVQEYFGHLLAKRFNLEWYFEGGRSRTGKLRPPRFGLLRYVAAALSSGRADDVYLVPVSITYERLPEVSTMAAEQVGAEKKKEGLAWLAKYARSQRARAGSAYVRIGEPFLLRERLAPAGADEAQTRIALQKVAFDVAVGINRVTPVTPNALMALTLLGVRDEALTVTQVRQVIAPILDYIGQRNLPTTGLDGLRTDGGVTSVLAELQRAGVVSVYDGGREPVFWIAPGKHLDAAFYRNNAIHWFVNRAIVELAILHAAGSTSPDPLGDGWAEAKRLRDQLKFEFFFPDRDTYERELMAELELLAPDWREYTERPKQVHELLHRPGFLMAQRVLRSFLDAQLVVLEQLASLAPGADSSDRTILAQCEAVGQQMLLQGRLHGPESLSRELFQSALKLADNYRLRDPAPNQPNQQNDPAELDLPQRREQTAAQVRQIVASARTIEQLDASLRAEVTGAAG
jgi:glycerol-3-phosphate O-acyltransferase